MFDKEYAFRGKHCEYVVQLISEFDSKKHKLFQTNCDVYAIAPIIGFLYGRKSELDKSGNNTKIFTDKFLKEKDNLKFNYRLIILLDKEHLPNIEDRIDHAFRFFETEQGKADEELYESYVRGGVEVLYENLIQSANKEEDYFRNLYDFMESFDERYNQAISCDGILDLCQLARS